MNWKEFFFGKPQQKPVVPPVKAPPPVVDLGHLCSRGFSENEARGVLKAVMNMKREGSQTLFEGNVATNYDDLVLVNAMKPQSLKEFTKGAFNVANALISMWTQSVQDRQNYLMMSDELKKFYIVSAILDLITEDVLNPNEVGEILEIVSDDPKIQKEITKLCENIDFNVLVRDICRDFIDFGEYFLRLEVKPGKGLTGYYDDLDPWNVLAFYEGGMPKNFFLYDPEKKDYMVMPPHMCAHFIIGSRKQRIKVVDQFSMWGMQVNDNTIPKKVKEALPDYVRVGEPLFLPYIAKLRELQLLEQLIPATKLNQITQTQMVQIKLPHGMAPEKVMDALRRYESILNIPTGLDFTRDQISLAEVMTVTGKIRVIPQFGDSTSGDKGTLTPVNVRDNPPVDDLLGATKDIRAIVMSSLGIPPSLLYGSSDAEKQSELRLFSRYTRRLAAIQAAIKHGIKQIVLIHLVNLGIECTYKDFDVKFKQTLVDLSGLEKLEFDDAKKNIIGQSIDFINRIYSCPLLAQNVDDEQLLDWIREEFSILMNERDLFPKNPKKLLDMPVQSDPNGGIMPPESSRSPYYQRPPDQLEDPKSKDVTLDQ